MAGFVMMLLAMAIRYFCPPDSILARSPNVCFILPRELLDGLICKGIDTSLFDQLHLFFACRVLRWCSNETIRHILECGGSLSKQQSSGAGTICVTLVAATTEAKMTLVNVLAQSRHPHGAI